jgi:histidinol-phosphate aminotransferase
VLAALREADPSRYPDPASTALRAALAEFHDVRPERIVVAASASEFIGRLTAAVRLQSAHSSVFAPVPGYADYGRAADTWGLRRAPMAGDASLVWVTEPASPSGRSARCPAVRDGAVLVVDEAYAALRLEGEAPALPPFAWRLVSPNKALGLTGVRGAYAIAPEGADGLLRSLERLCPSWPLGVFGEVMLRAWAEPATQRWVEDSRSTLLAWKAAQLALGEELGWVQDASVTPFYVARWPGHEVPEVLARLRERGIKLRDTTSLGLPGAVRVGVRPPEAQAALRDAWREVTT